MPRNSSSMPYRATLIGALAMATVTTANAEVLSVSGSILAKINADATAKSKLLAKLGVDGNSSIKGIRVMNGRMDAIGKKLHLPERKLSFITSSEVLNCVPVEVTRNVTLSKETTNTVAVTKSETFGAEVSATVSASYMGAEVSGTATASYDYTSENMQENSSTVKVEDSTSVLFPAAVGGFVSVLESMKLTATGIPYTITFVPTNETQFEFQVEKAANGQACLYEGVGFSGRSACYPVGKEVSSVGDLNDKIRSIKLEGKARAEVFEHINFGGAKTNVNASLTNTGLGPANYSSLKVRGDAETQTVMLKWSDIKALVPKTVQSFDLNGTISIDASSTDGKRISTYAMTDDEVKAACERLTGRPQGADKQKQAGMAGKGPMSAATYVNSVDKQRFESLLKSGKLKKIN